MWVENCRSFPTADHWWIVKGRWLHWVVQELCSGKNTPVLGKYGTIGHAHPTPCSLAGTAKSWHNQLLNTIWYHSCQFINLIGLDMFIINTFLDQYSQPPSRNVFGLMRSECSYYCFGHVEWMSAFPMFLKSWCTFFYIVVGVYFWAPVSWMRWMGTSNPSVRHWFGHKGDVSSVWYGKGSFEFLLVGYFNPAGTSSEWPRIFCSENRAADKYNFVVL
jgi:hypothetical protein